MTRIFESRSSAAQTDVHDYVLFRHSPRTKGLTTLAGLVLLDLGLPRMNGLNVIRRLRNDLHVIDIPVVIITGYDKHFDTAVAAGCDDYLIKPIDFGRLESILNYYVPLRASSASA